MTRIHNILCPVDLSPLSARALGYARQLARWSGADLVVQFVQPTPLPPALWLTAAPPELASVRAFVRETIGEPADGLRVGHGDVVAEIHRAAEQIPADVIVMGTHGMTGVRRWALGSVTEGVLRDAAVPVFTVPEPVTDTTPDRMFGTVVCGVDRSETSRVALQYALGLTRRAGGRLIVVHALDSFADEGPEHLRHFDVAECRAAVTPAIRAEYEALVPAHARQAGAVTVRVPHGCAGDALLQAARDEDGCLIVLGSSRWGWRFGSTTRKLLRHASCPVLCIPELAADAREDERMPTPLRAHR